MNKIILMLPLLIEVFENIDENLMFKCTLCYKSYETFSLQGSIDVNSTISYFRVK